MNTITTRSIAALAATGALVAGGAAAANATGDGDHGRAGVSASSHSSGDTSKRSEVAQLVHDAVEDGTVTIAEEDAIKQAIEDNTKIEFESLKDAAPQG